MMTKNHEDEETCRARRKRCPSGHLGDIFVEDKILIVLDGLRCEDSIAELCRREDIAQRLYYT